MAKSAQNKPIVLHPGQESTPKKPWERLPGEPARWFMLFKIYCQMGRGRSLQAVWEQEHQAKRGKRQHGEPSDAQTHLRKSSVSGAWTRAFTQWKWHERAEEWDNFQREERNKKLLAFLDHEAEYISKAQRLNALDTVMCGLMKTTLESPVTAESYKNYLAIMRVILATLREIRREMGD